MGGQGRVGRGLLKSGLLRTGATLRCGEQEGRWPDFQMQSGKRKNALETPRLIESETARRRFLCTGRVL